MASHTAQLEASGQAQKFSTALCSCLPDLSAEQKQVKLFFVAPLHLLKCAKLQLYGYCDAAQSHMEGQWCEQRICSGISGGYFVVELMYWGHSFARRKSR